MPPFSPDRPTDADRRACLEAIRQGSRSFHAASLLLPRRVREPAYGLYAFCRLSDDAIDLHAGKREALERLRERLDRAAEGRPAPHPADRVFAEVLARHAIPRALPEALLEGLAWDAEGRTYETLSDLRAYAARVAGSVGAMMALIMGARSPEALARAGDLGVAMQLTNIARDVGEDARAGRLYLPLAWLRDARIDPAAFLERPAFDARLAGIVARLLGEADALYARGERGVPLLPLACRPAILAASRIYAGIGRDVERHGGDSVSRRARVGGWRKVALLGRALAATPLTAASAASPALDEVRFLVHAVPVRPEPETPSSGIRARFIWTLDLFERLHERDRLQRRLAP